MIVSKIPTVSTYRRGMLHEAFFRRTEGGLYKEAGFGNAITHDKMNESFSEDTGKRLPFDIPDEREFVALTVSSVSLPDSFNDEQVLHTTARLSALGDMIFSKRWSKIIEMFEEGKLTLQKYPSMCIEPSTCYIDGKLMPGATAIYYRVINQSCTCGSPSCNTTGFIPDYSDEGVLHQLGCGIYGFIYDDKLKEETTIAEEVPAMLN